MLKEKKIDHVHFLHFNENRTKWKNSSKSNDN